MLLPWGFPKWNAPCEDESHQNLDPVSGCLRASSLGEAAPVKVLASFPESHMIWLSVQRSPRRRTNRIQRNCRHLRPHAGEVTRPDLALPFLNMENTATASLPPSKALAPQVDTALSCPNKCMLILSPEGDRNSLYSSLGDAHSSSCSITSSVIIF